MQTGIYLHILTERETDGWVGDRQTDRQTDRQAGRQTDRQAGRQAGRVTDGVDRENQRQKGGDSLKERLERLAVQTDRQTVLTCFAFPTPSSCLPIVHQ